MFISLINDKRLLKLKEKDLSDKDILFYSWVENRIEQYKEDPRIPITFLEGKDYSYKVGCSFSYILPDFKSRKS